jgi:hypothetical protein
MKPQRRKGWRRNRRSVPALSVGAYTTTLLLMVDIVKGGWRAPLHPHQARLIFMYLRAIFCTFQISLDFYIVPVGGRGGGIGGAGEGEGARERGIECILYGYT